MAYPNVAPLIPRKPTSKFGEIGQTGLNRWNGQVYEEFLQSLRGLQGIKVYREMRDNDPVVGASLYAIEQVIRQATWLVEPASDSDTEDAKAAEFLGSCLGDMTHTWNDHISEALSMLPYGWAYHEVVYKLRKGDSNDPKLKSKFSDGLVGWRRLPLRLQNTLYSWEIDDYGDIEGMTQVAPPDYKERYIKIDKAIHYRTKTEGNNPEGRSLLRNAYRPWFYKKNIETIEAIGIERDLVGLAVITGAEGFDITADENKDTAASIDKLLSALRRDEQEGLYIPFGWEIKLLGNGASRRQFDVDKVINRYDKRIAISVLAQFIMLGMDRVGSFALSSDQNDLFMLAVQGILNIIADTLNTFAVPRLFALNPTFKIKEGKYPKLLPSRVSTPKLTDLAAYINALSKLNILPTESPRLQRELLRIGGMTETATRKLGELYTQKDDSGMLPGTPKPIIQQPSLPFGKNPTNNSGSEA